MKKILSTLLLVMLLFNVTACSISSNDNEKTAKTTTEESSSEIKLKDQAGREVTLASPAKKIVSCYYISTYACLALGLEDKLVGIEGKANNRNIYKMAAPELLELPSVGTLKEFNVETVASLKPDLVILPKKLMDYADALTELKIPVLVVYPESQELMEEMLTLISKATGVEDKSKELLNYYNDTLKDMDKITSKVKEEDKVSVYMAGNSSYLTTAPKSMYQSNIISLAGGINAAASIEGDYWTEVSYENILAMNPEVIVVPATAEYSVDDILNDAQLSSIAAVQNKAVYQMPKSIEEWDSPIPSGVLGIRWLCSIINSKYYSFEDMKKDVTSFYKEFYGFDLDTNLITK